jgi:metal-responsive CopG/Arc/MetJ family transcriptional regulator
MGYTSKTISLTLPQELLARIDRLAERELATRSDIIRQATIKYVREEGINKVEINETPKAEPTELARDMQKLSEKYPFVHPDDHQLLEFLDDSVHS